MGRAAVPETAVRHLRALGAELARNGIDSDVVMSGYRPRLRLHLVIEDLYPDASFEDNVVAAPDMDGHWSFWWPWVEQIADADDPGKAAEMICAPLTDDDPDNGDMPWNRPGDDGKGFAQGLRETPGDGAS